MSRYATLLLLLAPVLLAETYGLAPGPVKLESAGALAFGPDGILFVGDTAAGLVYAFDTGDRVAHAAGALTAVEGIDQKIAALLGVMPSDVTFNDVKVNPVSKNVYLSVSRGRGNNAIPVILRVDGAGAISELPTANILHSSVALPGLPAAPKGPRRRASRELVITDLQYTAGKLVIAGLSNEDFSSTLRLVPFPFVRAGADAAIGTSGTSVEIYHTSHFTYETSSPVRTMVPYTAGGVQYLLAAYTCTPLVKLRMSDLKDGARITGDTLAELGRHSSPLDMIFYQAGGHDYLLVANSSRGVLKLSIDHLDQFETVNEDGGDADQIAMKRVVGLKGVGQLDRYDATHAVLLADVRDQLDLRIIPLP